MKKNYTMGIFFLLLASIGFSSTQMFVKLANEISVPNKLLFRNLITVFITSVIIMYNKKSFRLPKSEIKLVFLRVTLGLIGFVLNFYALNYIYLADSTTIQKLSSFLLLLLSYIFLNEKFNKIQLFGLIGSFIGVIFIVKPGFNEFNIGHLMVIIAAIASSGAYCSIRSMAIRGKIEPIVIVFYFSLFTSIVTLPFAINNLPELNIKNIYYLLGIGIFGSIGQYGITFAYKFAPSKEISVVEYTQVLFSSILGYFILNEVPDKYSFIGYMIIVSLGIYLYKYNKKENNKN